MAVSADTNGGLSRGRCCAYDSARGVCCWVAGGKGHSLQLHFARRRACDLRGRPTWDILPLFKFGLTECLLSGIAKNAVYCSY
jgi:hypothetical protein